jgi:hypothetical protein
MNERRDVHVQLPSQLTKRPNGLSKSRGAQPLLFKRKKIKIKIKMGKGHMTREKKK